MMFETIAIGIVSFVGTNIDDLFVDMLLFAGAGTKREACGVVIGKYLGIVVLTVLSIFGAYGVQLLPDGFAAWLGIVPVALGVRELLALRKEKRNEDETETGSSTAFRTAMLTIAGGADNLSVYIPLFAGFAGWQIAVTVGVYAAMTGAWCLLSRRLTELQHVRHVLDNHRHVLAPTVYIVLGLYVLLKGLL